MDNHLKQDAQIEEALQSYPLAEMPRSLTFDVLARIQKDTRPQLVTWNDLVLSLVLALSISAVFFAIQSLPPIMLAKLRIQGILLYQDFLVNARWLVPSLLFGGAAVLSALTIPSLVRMTFNHRQ
ncbi:MAG: hypothetical protein C3F07_11360 [Anaerolineales bacterium]|nr:hypothetical protein [Anaerolineae bacterium]PWB72647.1 MAG: hypothetical protein C3F07_11360 [Anaerolineales bacterium]